MTSPATIRLATTPTPDIGDKEDTTPANADEEQAAEEADENAPDEANDDQPNSDRDKPREP